MILGISLDENFVYVSVDGDPDIKSYPFAIGRNLSTKTWFIGDEAKDENVESSEIVIDKLYYIMENDGNARIGEDAYEARDLVKIFFNCLFIKYSNIEYVTVAVRQNNVKILSKIKYALNQISIKNFKYKVTTYSEAFISFLKSNPPSYYTNTVSLFDYTEKALTYYELIRYKSDELEYWQIITKSHLALPLELLSGEAGKKVCDNLLFDFAKKCINEEVYNHIILSGIGFAESSSYREFMTYVCSVANVETDVYFFSKSATLLSKDIINNNFDKNVILMTDARTTATIKLTANINQVKTKIELIKPGFEWLNVYNYSFDVIVEDQREIKFEIIKVLEGLVKEASLVIPDDVKLRDDKTNLFEVSLTFLQQNLLQISLIDKGFGEFYEANRLLAATQSVEI